MSRYIVTILAPSPLIGTWRREVEAPSPEFARAIAMRDTGAPRGSQTWVRPARETSYRKDFHDSITDRFNKVHA